MSAISASEYVFRSAMIHGAAVVAYLAIKFVIALRSE